MAGLVPAIHVLLFATSIKQDMDARDKHGGALRAFAQA
jgi:hypothetical protein